MRSGIGSTSKSEAITFISCKVNSTIRPWIGRERERKSQKERDETGLLGGKLQGAVYLRLVLNLVS